MVPAIRRLVHPQNKRLKTPILPKLSQREMVGCRSREGLKFERNVFSFFFFSNCFSFSFSLQRREKREKGQGFGPLSLSYWKNKTNTRNFRGSFSSFIYYLLYFYTHFSHWIFFFHLIN